VTSPENAKRPPRSPSGIASARQVEALRRIEEAQAAAQSALPVRIFHRLAAAPENVFAHFEYSPDDASWSVFGDVSRGAHGLVISRLEVRPAETSTGVTGGLMRKVPTGELLAAVRAWAAVEAARKEGTRALLGEEPVQGVFEEGDERAPQRGGRAPLTPDLLREVAEAYLEENAPKSPPGAMKRMAKRFDRPEETLRTWVTRARKDGWLGPSTKGRAGAEPGPKLIAWVTRQLGDMMADPEYIRREALHIAAAWDLEDADAIEAALRAYADISERDISHRMGLPPLEMAIAAQKLFRKPLGAELAERMTRLNGDEQAARAEMEQEIRAEMAERGVTVESDNA
jgi:transposase-like protein